MPSAGSQLYSRLKVEIFYSCCSKTKFVTGSTAVISTLIQGLLDHLEDSEEGQHPPGDTAKREMEEQYCCSFLGELSW